MQVVGAVERQVGHRASCDPPAIRRNLPVGGDIGDRPIDERDIDRTGHRADRQALQYHIAECGECGNRTGGGDLAEGADTLGGLVLGHVESARRVDRKILRFPSRALAPTPSWLPQWPNPPASVLTVPEASTRLMTQRAVAI